MIENLTKEAFEGWLRAEQAASRKVGSPVSSVTPIANFLRDAGEYSALQLDAESVSSSFISPRAPLPTWAADFSKAAWAFWVKRFENETMHNRPLLEQMSGDDCLQLLAMERLS